MAKRKPKVLTREQKTKLRLSISIEEAEKQAHHREAKCAGLAKARTTRHTSKPAQASEWTDELALHPHWERQARQINAARNYDVTGFLEYILAGNVQIPQRDAAGQGRAGIGPLVPRKWQMKIGRELIEHRLKSTSRWLEYVIKGRQRGLSVWWDSIIWSDSMMNNGIQSVVSAHQLNTLKSLNQNFRTFAGRKKEAGKAERMADAILETPGGSVIQLLGAGDSLGRGAALTHVHISEADYLEDLDDTLDSVLASMIKAPWATAMLETTIRRGSNSEFKDAIENALREQERRKQQTDGMGWLTEGWNVRFLPWTDDETAAMDLTAAQAASLMASIESSDNRTRDYERWLRDDLKCSPGQIAWWRRMWSQDARRNLTRMMEMYPTTLNEALTLVSSTSFFSRDAIDFYRGMCREPAEQYRINYDGMKVVEKAAAGSLMSLWHQPVSRYTYVIGADHADADTRVADKGSECYAVVLEVETGRQMAEWHGYANTSEFAMILWRMHMWFNDALLVPEVPVGGGGVVDALVHQFQCTKIYEREKDGAVVEKILGVYGFDTKGGSRKKIVSRMQDNFNAKTLNIYSHYLLDQLVEFGKRGGAAQKKQQKIGQMPDDGCMALALCMVGHENAINGAWLPKDAEGHVDNPRDLLLHGERAEAAREALVVGQLSDLDFIKQRQARERDVYESIFMDG